MKSSLSEKTLFYLNSLSVGQKLLLITLLALASRLYIILNAATISVDSTIDLSLARAFVEGNYLEGVDIERPPLHPLLVSLLYPLTGELELSARLVSLVFGLLMIPLAFWLGRYIYDERTGLLTALFVAIHPYLIRYSGETLRETIYYFFALVLVLVGLKAILRKNACLMFLVGVISAFAYLNKHASIGFLIIFSMWIAFYNIRNIGEDLTKRVWLILCGWMVFIVAALPYLLFLKQETGKVTVTGKLPYFSPINAIWTTITLKNDRLLTFLSHFPEALSIPFFILFVAYIVVRYRDGFTEKEKFLLTLVVAYSVVHLFVLPERRYLVRLAPLELVFAGAGFTLFIEWIRRRYHEAGASMIVATVTLLVVVQLAQGLTSLHKHRLPERLAGRWILENLGRNTSILSRKPIVVYYADANFIDIWNKKGWKLRRIIEYGRRHGAQYLAGYPHKLRRLIPDFDKEEKRYLKRIKSFPADGGEGYVIYKIL